MQFGFRENLPTLWALVTAGRPQKDPPERHGGCSHAKLRTWAGVELPIEDLRHDTVGKPNQVVVGGGAIKRRDARHDVHCTSSIRIARAASTHHSQPDFGQSGCATLTNGGAT
jgi:hypothetical protein